MMAVSCYGTRFKVTRHHGYISVNVYLEDILMSTISFTGAIDSLSDQIAELGPPVKIIEPDKPKFASIDWPNVESQLASLDATIEANNQQTPGEDHGKSGIRSEAR